MKNEFDLHYNELVWKHTFICFRTGTKDNSEKANCITTFDLYKVLWEILIKSLRDSGGAENPDQMHLNKIFLNIKEPW